MGAMSTELPQVPESKILKASLPPPRIPPLPPPEQFGPPKAQISIDAKLGMLDIEALTIPPSVASEKETPVALGSIPKPNETNRFVDKEEVLFSITSIVNVELLKPLKVNEPLPVRLPAALEYAQVKFSGLLEPDEITVALLTAENNPNSVETAAIFAVLRNF